MDKCDKSATKLFADAGIHADEKEGLNEDQLCEIIGEYDALVVRSATTVTPKVVAAAKKMKIIGRAGLFWRDRCTAQTTTMGLKNCKSTGFCLELCSHRRCLELCQVVLASFFDGNTPPRRGRVRVVQAQCECSPFKWAPPFVFRTVLERATSLSLFLAASRHLTCRCRC